MSQQSIFNTQFYKTACQVNTEINKWSLKDIIFPKTRFVTQGDQFFRDIWRAIDKSKKYIWITTYAMDKSISANTTMIKLIEARKRGVHTVLFVDDVQQWMQPQMLEAYKMAGGVFASLNPQWKLSSLKKFKDQQIFRRHHQKIFVSDNIGVIGSSNIQSGYASTKFGSWVFKDLNLYSENMNLKQYRDHIYDIAQYYKIPLASDRSSQTIKQELDKQFPNSVFYKKSSYKFLKSIQPHTMQIQQQILKGIKSAKKSILIVQPYYFPMSVFEQQVQKALQRGVKIQLITSATRDQPVYRYLKNGLLLKKLIISGLTAYELHQKLLHTKAYIIDQKTMNIGSFNNDRWSWRINNQTNLYIQSRMQYEKVRQYFNDLKKNSIIVNPQPYLSFSKKIKMIFWQKFMYLSQCVMNKKKQFNFQRFIGYSHSYPPDTPTN